MTSAPSCARVMPPSGAATNEETSITRRPARGAECDASESIPPLCQDGPGGIARRDRLLMFLRALRLRADRPVRAGGVPGGGLGELLHDGSGVRCVDDVAAADVHRHVALAVVKDQVTRLE